MNPHPTTIHRPGKPPVRVERTRRRAWSRRDVHAIGLAAVADAVGQAAQLGMGGVMTGERLRGLLVRKPASDGVEKRDIGCATTSATRPERPADLSTGALADDVCRHIWTERGRFAPALYDARV